MLDEKIEVTCKRCGNKWMYKGKKIGIKIAKVSCPVCFMINPLYQVEE